MADKTMSRCDGTEKIHLEPDKGRADIAVEFHLEPAVSAKLCFPPRVYRIKREPWQPRRVNDFGRVAIAPCDADRMFVRVGRTRLHSSRFLRDSDPRRASRRAVRAIVDLWIQRHS